MKNIIFKTISEHLNENSVFIFPTQMAADLWADKIITESEVSAVSMERFVPWDIFKSESIRSTKQNKTAIPSQLRKFFACQIIAENKKSPFLKNLINPEYASLSDGFSNWISSILPALSTWKKYFSEKNLTPDDEDSDLLELYDRYSQFLEKNNLFDPAWEFPPFKSYGFHYYIFFPEILSDYFEYENILKSSPDITTINLCDVPKEFIPEQSEGIFFKNARTEVKNIALYLKKIHSEQNIPWNQIAINVPDIETYAPFIEQDLSLFQIPFVTKNSTSLSSTCAGNIFFQMNDCVQNNFSFDSIRNLLLNTTLPWINEDLNLELINFGKENNCICSFKNEEKIFDPWEESFKTKSQNERLSNFYNSLKKILSALVNSKTFSEINRHYFEFKTKYFSKDFLPATDRILSRALTVLSKLIDLENKFPEAKVPKPYDFFLDELTGEKYLAQQKTEGVQILPYKMAATAPFKLQIVVDSSQTSLSVTFKKLNFLRSDKLKKLFGENYEDTDVSEIFVQLYKINSDIPCFFTGAEKTFSGFSQISSYLSEKRIKTLYFSPELEKLDSYSKEKSWFRIDEKSLFSTDKNFPDKISVIQKNAFENWKNLNLISKETEVQESLKEKIREKIKESLCTNPDSPFPGKYRLSVTQLQNYFDCPRKWFNQYILNLKEQDNEAEFLSPFSIGNIYHKIFELYGKTLKAKNRQILLDENENLFPEDIEVIKSSVKKAIESARESVLSKEWISAAEFSIFTTMKDSITEFSRLFNGMQFYGNEIKLNKDFPGKNYFLTGNVDCVLFDQKLNEYFLIDFKTSGISQDHKLYSDDVTLTELLDDQEDEPYNLTEKISSVYEEALEEAEKPSFKQTPCILNEIPNFQMASYIHLLENSSKITVHNAAFYSITKKTLTPVFGKEIFRKNLLQSSKKTKSVCAENYKPTMKFFYQCLDEFAKNISKGEITISDEKQNFDICYPCAFRAICRRVFQIGRKTDTE